MIIVIYMTRWRLTHFSREGFDHSISVFGSLQQANTKAYKNNSILYYIWLDLTGLFWDWQVYNLFCHNSYHLWFIILDSFSFMSLHLTFSYFWSHMILWNISKILWGLCVCMYACVCSRTHASVSMYDWLGVSIIWILVLV